MALAESVRPNNVDDVVKAVKGIWQDLLGMDVDRETNFFEAGGNSFLLMQMIEGFEKEFGFRVPLLMVFEHPTLAAVSSEIFINVLAEEAQCSNSDLDVAT